MVRVISLCFVLLLAACGGDFNELPPNRPAGTVAGYVIDGPIANADVSIYAFAEGRKGRVLGAGKTAADGSFSIKLHARDQLVYIEAQGGSYIEEASAKTVNLLPGERLTALAHYQSATTLHVVITPYSHLATGLAEYKINQGVDVDTAATSAIQNISALVGLNIASVVPQGITSLSNTLVNADVSDNYAYGFMLAAISSWTAWASQKSGLAAHETITSISLAQLMYRDIVADGVLDGQGFDENGVTIVELQAGAIALDTEVYHKGFGQHMLNVANSAVNQTGFSVIDVRERANYLIQSNPLSAPGSTSAEDTIGPAINGVPYSKLYENGIFNFAVRVDDPVGVSLVSFDVDNAFIGKAADLSTPSIAIDTRQYADGVHTIGVSAEDMFGNRSRVKFDVLFANASPFILINSPRVTNKEIFTLQGIFAVNNFDFQTLLIQNRDVSVAENGAWQVDITLKSGKNDIAIVALDKQGSQFEVNYSIVLDTVPPRIFVSYSDARYIADENIFAASLSAASDVGPPLYVENAEANMEGVTVTPGELESRSIPFIEVVIAELPKPDSAPVVRIQYILNDTLMSEKEIFPSAYGLLEGNYLIYLALDMLHGDWKTAKPKDVHRLMIIAQDAAANESRFELKFKTRFRGKSDQNDAD